MTYPLQENADGVFANRIVRPEQEMQAIFTEIGLRTCGRGAFPLPAGLPCRRRQAKSRRQRRTFYLTRLIPDNLPALSIDFPFLHRL